MGIGAVTISIDLELAWGNWDNLGPQHIENVATKERPIIGRIVDLLDRYDLPVTWAFVAALLDPASAKGRPGCESLWYAPDVIDRIRKARVRHDLGSHGGRHIYFDQIPEIEVGEDLDFACSTCAKAGISIASFVFPRNRVGHKHLLSEHGIRVYRGTDQAWHQRLRNRNELLGRGANLLDKMLPLKPELVQPERDEKLVNLPGSLLFLGRNGVRKFAPPAVALAKLRSGLKLAQQSGGVFHLWFHPSNFWHDTDVQFDIFTDFARETAAAAARGDIEIKPMAAFA